MVRAKRNNNLLLILSMGQDHTNNNFYTMNCEYFKLLNARAFGVNYQYRK